MTQQIIFLIITFFALLGGIGVVASRNIYYSALFLVISLVSMSGYYIMLNAGFLAAVQIVVYVGAIAILILFAIMLSRSVMTVNEAQDNRQSKAALVTVPILFIALMVSLMNVKWNTTSTDVMPDMITGLGVAFMGSYVIPFEVVSILLLVALVGAIIIARDTSDITE